MIEIMKKTKSGFTLIEAMIFILIFTIIAVSFYRTLSGGMLVLGDSRARIAATQLANEKIETLRNLAYENIDTAEDNPDSEVLMTQDVTRGGNEFKVDTDIRYVDDIFDNIDPDARPNDYKQIRITVRWGVGYNKNITMYTHLAPPGTEELYNGGILSLEIRQTDGQVVSGARVKIVDIETGITKYDNVTESDGKIYLIGLTPKNYKYKITVTKDGYYGVETMPPFDQTPYKPSDEHASVVLAEISPKTIFLDHVSALQLKAQDPTGVAISGADFALEGGREFGDTIANLDAIPQVFSVPVYSYPKSDHSFNVTGEFGFENESPGIYNFFWDPAAGSNANYEFWKIYPMYGTYETKFIVNPGSLNNIAAILLPKDKPSLFVTVVDETDNTPISDAKVIIKNTALAYESEELVTDQLGKAYFPSSGDTLENLEYEITVNALDYVEKKENVTVSNLTQPVIKIVK